MEGWKEEDILMYDFYCKHPVSPKKLIEALEKLPEGVVLAKNPVGNLSVLKDGEYVGVIDLLEAEWFPDE